MSAPPIDQDQDDEEYASSEDSDFAPDAAPAPESEDEESESEDDPAARDRPSKRRRTTGGDANGADDVGYDNSGDEAIIKRGEKKKKKKKRSKEGGTTAADEEDDDGGEGGLIKTRRQRAAEKEERRVAVSNGPVTIDVDAVWAQMLSGDPAALGVQAKSTESANADAETSNTTAAAGESKSCPQPSPAVDPSALVRIKRTYNFAGKVHSEEKLVPRDSAEAKLFFASQGGSEDAAAAVDASPPKRRIVRKAFRSRFEPQIDLLPRRMDLDLSVTGRTKAGRDAQAKKLNTVEKSRMDWASYVDKEGIKDELELAGRAKGSFAAREDFLARSEAKRQEDALRARKTGRA